MNVYHNYEFIYLDVDIEPVKIDDKCITICRFVSTFVEQVRARLSFLIKNMKKNEHENGKH